MTEPDRDEQEPSGPHLPKGYLPKAGLSWLAIAYAALGASVLVIYLLAGVRGWHFFSPEKDELPSSVRHSPGGYRSYAFWHAGYQGGK